MQKGNNLAALLCLALLSGTVQAEDNYYSVDITGPEGRTASQRRAPPPPVRRTAAGQAAVARVIPPPAPLPAGVTAQGTHQIRGNDTLWTIANAYLPPERNFNEYQIIASLYRFNPHAFINGDVNRLITGATLNVPSPNIIALEQTQSGVNVLQNGLRTLPAIDLPQAAASSAAASAAPMSDDELDRVISNITPTAPPAGTAAVATATAGPQSAGGAQAAPFVPPAYAPAQAAPAVAPAQAAPAVAPAQAAPVTAPVTTTPPSTPVASNSPVQITSGDIPLPDLAAPGQAADTAGSQPPSDLGEQIDIMAIKNIIDTFDKKIDRKTDRFEKDMAKNMKRAEKIAQNAAESTAQTKVDDLMVKYEAMITDLQTTNAELRGTISKLTDQMTKVKQTAMDTQDHMAMMDARLDNSPSAHSFSVQGPLMWIVLGLGTLALIMAATLMALKKKHPVTRSSYHPADDDIGDLDDDMGELLTSGISINPNDPDNASFPDDRPPDGGPGGGAKAPARPGQFTDDAIQVPDELMRQASQAANTSAPAATAETDTPVVAQAEPEPPIAEMPVPPAPAQSAAAAAAARTAPPKSMPAEPDMSPEELAAKQAWDAAASEAPSPAVANAIAAAAAKKAAESEAATQADTAPAIKATAGGATAELDAMADWGEALAAQAAPQAAQAPAAKAKAPAAGQTKASAKQKPGKAAAKPAEKVAKPASKAAKPAAKPADRTEAPSVPEIRATGKAVKQAAAAPAVKAADAVSELAAQGKAAVQAVASGAAAAAADAVAEALAADAAAAEELAAAAEAVPDAAAQAEDAAADMMAEALAADAAAAEELAAAAEAVPDAAAAAADDMFSVMQEHADVAEIDIGKFAGMAPAAAADTAASDDADEISADINMARFAEAQSASISGPDDMQLAGMNVAEALAETGGAAAAAPDTTSTAGSDLLTAEAAGLESAIQGAHERAIAADDDAPLDARHLQASLQDTAAAAAAGSDDISLAEQQMRESMFSAPDAAAAHEPALNDLAGMNVGDALAELEGSRPHKDMPAEQNLVGMNVDDALAELDAAQIQAAPSAQAAPAAGVSEAAPAPSAHEAMAQSDADIMSMLSGDAPADALEPASDDWEMSVADITNMIARSPADELSTAADDQVLNADITLDGPAEEALQPQEPHHGPSRISSFVEDVRSNAKNDMFGQLQAEPAAGMDNMEYRRFTDELNLAHLYFETGDTDEAMNIVNEVIEKGNDELIQKARTLASQYAS